MKLPSVKQLIHESSVTLRRFPFVLGDAIVGTIASIILIELDSAASLKFLENVLLACALGLPLFTALAVLAEKRELQKSLNLLMQCAGVFALTAYCFSLPQDVFLTPGTHIIRFFLLNLGLHLFVAFAPYTGRGEMNGFWQFNKALFLRFLTAVLYSAVLYIGLSIALWAIDNLFDIDIDGDWYGELWVAIAGVFNTWFFLAGVPEKFASLDADTSYPKGLKVFTQYILISLVFVYLVILYAYEGKIIIEWDWPRGWVSNLVLGFTITGILSLLLLWPIQERIENKWVRTFARRYYFALIPLVVMLLLAIWKRISEYGITENRYFVAVLGLWLGGVVLYFLLSSTKSIKVIPTTLCVIAFLASFGPWGAFSVSERSQIGRLTGYLTMNGMLVNNKIKKPKTQPSFNDTREISSIVKYLHETHGLASMQTWFDQDLETLGKDSLGIDPRYQKPALVVQLMGMHYIDQWQLQQDNFFSFQANRNQSIAVGGYEHFIRSRYLNKWGMPRDSIRFAEIQYNINCDFEESRLTIRRTDKESGFITLDLSRLIKKQVEQHAPQYNVPLESMTLEDSSSGMRVRVYVLSIQGRMSGEQYTVEQMEVEILAGRGR